MDVKGCVTTLINFIVKGLNAFNLSVRLIIEAITLL